MADKHIQTLNPRHFKILDLCMRGMTSQQISSYLGMSARQINVIINSPSFQHQLAVKRRLYEDELVHDILDEEKEAADLLKASARDAARKLIQHLNSGDEKISIRAAESVLDRTGHPKQAVEKTQNIGNVFMLSKDEANRIVEAIELDKQSLPCRQEQPAEFTDKESTVSPSDNSRPVTTRSVILTTQARPSA